MQFHEASNIFPLMGKEELEELRVDISENGLHEAIWTYQGQIIDGRNRYLACEEIGEEPRYREWGGGTREELIAFIVSLNLKRRHLTASQRAVIALELEKEYAKIAKKRYNTLAHKSVSDVARMPHPKGLARDQAAKVIGAGSRYIQDAKKIQAEAPDLIPQIASGELNIPQAKREVKRRKQQKKPRPQAVQVSDRSPILIVGCAENIPQIEDDSVDLIITSPPYNLGSENWPMGGDGESGYGAREPRNGIGYADNIEEYEYQNWQIEVFKEMYRVACTGASFFYNHKVRQKQGHIIHPLSWIMNADNPWIIRQEIIWDRRSTHNHCAQLFWPHDERIYWMTKGNPILPESGLLNCDLDIDKHDKARSTVWSFHGPVANTWHPAPFPEDLPKRIIGTLYRSGMTVLDPFAGSCTTLVAALKFEDVKAIGVDINREYLIQAIKEHKWTSTI